mmetsp:Transcript_85527/g.275936  ORF Transcript_85527/g.275936 Transcript_85527/m.275936 type:complete len:348 (-) Transcript_85527:8-1051(-)
MGQADVDAQEGEPPAESEGAHGGWSLAQRAARALEVYLAFRSQPGQRCPECWLVRRFCACAELPEAALTTSVAVLIHPSELGRLRASNTAKLLLRFGADLFVWGHEEHDARLRELLREAEDAEARAPSTSSTSASGITCWDGDAPALCRVGPAGAEATWGGALGAVVLFPCAGSRPAAELSAELARRRAAAAAVEVATGAVGEAASTPPALPRCIVVLDGGWKETRKMNASIDVNIARCIVSNATRDEYGGTRKYKEGNADRVQTAAAFIALLKELGDDSERVAALKACLSRFTESFDRQVRWSGVCEPRVTLPRGSVAVDPKAACLVATAAAAAAAAVAAAEEQQQ